METKQLQLVTPRQGEMLEELGFNWETEYVYDCYCQDVPKLKKVVDYKETDYYDIDYIIPAPTVALALQWMRDEKGIIAFPAFGYMASKWQLCKMHSKDQYAVSEEKFDSYEAAESALLTELLTIL